MFNGGAMDIWRNNIRKCNPFKAANTCTAKGSRAFVSACPWISFFVYQMGSTQTGLDNGFANFLFLDDIELEPLDGNTLH